MYRGLYRSTVARASQLRADLRRAAEVVLRRFLQPTRQSFVGRTCAAGTH